MDLDDGLHVVACALDARGPAVELARALGALQVSLVADDHREAAVGAFAVDGGIDFALEWVEAEGLADRDELAAFGLGELGREADGGEVVEDSLIRDVGDGLNVGGDNDGERSRPGNTVTADIGDLLEDGISVISRECVRTCEVKNSHE